MNNKKQRFPDSLLVLLLFGIFAACILAVLLTGANAYKKLTKRDELAFDSRTAARYLETRLHQADEKGRIFLGDFEEEEKKEEGQVLFLEEQIDGVSYHTRVYYYDGYIRELFCKAGTEMTPEAGEKIIPIRKLDFEWGSNGLLCADLTDSDGKEQQVFYRIRSGKGDTV